MTFEEWKPIFTLFGVVCVGVILVGLVWVAIILAKEGIEQLIWRYNYKHRFDKPPTAACYCRDCEQFNKENGRCFKIEHRRVGSGWFCKDATPRKKPAKGTEKEETDC